MYEKQMTAIAEGFQLVADSYEGHEQAVLDVIADCQSAMEEEREGAIGAWEQRELDYARVAVREGFLRLALVAAEKALIVSQLPRDEYEYGLNYGCPQ
ncbi:MULTISPECIES: hypothetical protein [Burkholderia cepacia complex]|uniref:hypothetical protein n=1 Tax=Burkholderia cepacia complex TaxID=87882 RepID=UPI000758F851|nr:MULTISPECIES: hypothetical protein [Burkholderia cepacia complex]KVF80072.1 hypothetical protein WJ18_13965 [Burkholderia vietnamiensis]KVF84899.1 hypothetical protein WJ19_18405 [Burkholderia vietnamiensis]KVF86676.1 hypothetical protein WJ20_23650 [Burkholderia vietnamiensis]KVG03613.1 hypothetical protein WJ22_00835 [Burkholderia vietnamiensis]